MVRRSRDDAVVGRHLAERRVRHLDGEQAARRRASPSGTSPVDEALETQSGARTSTAEVDARRFSADVDTPAQIDEAFDAIAYEKGAAVLRMVESYVGAETFRKGVNAYSQRTPTATRRREDFWTAIAAASGKPVDRILPTFVNQPGVPLVDVALACRGQPTRTSTPAAALLPRPALLAERIGGRWQIPVCVKTAVATRRDDLVLRRAARSRADADARGSALPAVGVRQRRRAGLLPHRVPPEMLRALAPRVQDEADRARAAVAGRRRVGAGARRPPRLADYLTLATGFGSERTSGVLDDVTNRLDFIHDYLTTDATRAAVRTLRALAARARCSPSSASAGARRQRRPPRAARRAHRRARDDRRRPRRRGPRARRSRRALAGGPPLDADARRRDRRRGGRARRRGAVRRAARGRRGARLPRSAIATSTRWRDSAIRRSSIARSNTRCRRSCAARTRALYLSRFLAQSGRARPHVGFVKQHWTELEPKVTIFGGDVGLVQRARRVLRRRARDDIRRSSPRTRCRPPRATLDQTIERIDNCIALREKPGASAHERGWPAR